MGCIFRQVILPVKFVIKSGDKAVMAILKG